MTTNIAGVIASSGQISGVAPNVRILPVVVNLNSQSYAERADAIRREAFHKAKQLSGRGFKNFQLAPPAAGAGRSASARIA